MAAQIYSPPEDLPVPEIDFKNYDHTKRLKAEAEWLEKLRQICKDCGSGKHAGKIIRDPVADGYAQYMIFSLRPLILIHLPLGDAWQSRWAKNWTSKDVREMAERQERLDKLFS